MTRYNQLFELFSSKKEGVLIPFVILGDPSVEMSLKIIDKLVESGADALELGIPFSDPIADGQTIQKAMLRAFIAGITVDQCFEILSTIRNKYPNLPIGLLVYANLVFNKGIDNFYHQCSLVGIDSVLIADIPIEESTLFRESAILNNIDQILVCPPNANDNLLRSIALNSKGYTYLLSRPGVTGNRHHIYFPLQTIVNSLLKYRAAPLIQGFGISDPKQIKKALMLGVTGVISGSAIIKIIENYQNDNTTLLKKLKIFVTKLKNATYYH